MGTTNSNNEYNAIDTVNIKFELQYISPNNNNNFIIKYIVLIGNLFVVCSDTGSIFIYNAFDCKLLYTVSDYSPNFTCIITIDNILISTSIDKTIKLSNIIHTNTVEVKTKSINNNNDNEPIAFLFSLADNLVGITRNGYVSKFLLPNLDNTTFQISKLIDNISSALTLTFENNISYLVVGSIHPNLLIYSLNDGSYIQSLYSNHRDKISVLMKLNNLPNNFISCSLCGTIMAWSYKNNNDNNYYYYGLWTINHFENYLDKSRFLYPINTAIHIGNEHICVSIGNGFTVFGVDEEKPDICFEVKDAHEDTIISLTTLYNDSILVTASSSSIKLWQFHYNNNGQIIRTTSSSNQIHPEILLIDTFNTHSSTITLVKALSIDSFISADSEGVIIRYKDNRTANYSRFVANCYYYNTIASSIDSLDSQDYTDSLNSAQDIPKKLPKSYFSYFLPLPTTHHPDLFSKYLVGKKEKSFINSSSNLPSPKNNNNNDENFSVSKEKDYEEILKYVTLSLQKK